MKRGINLYKIDKMVGLTFKNCIRLHLDSILLFKHKSYPSAFFLSVLSLEELGKMFLLTDFLWHSRTQGRFNLIYDKELKKKCGGDLEEYALRSMYSHSIKQWNVVRNLDGPRPTTKFFKSLCDKKMELLKQNSIYVGLVKKRGKVDLKSKIKNPFR